MSGQTKAEELLAALKVDFPDEVTRAAEIQAAINVLGNELMRDRRNRDAFVAANSQLYADYVASLPSSP